MSLTYKATEPSEVLMSTATGPVSLIRKPPMSIPISIWVPLLGLAWVFVNILLVDLGFRIGYQATCGLIAGGINGSILASIVLATLGEKLQAGTTGLLGGYGFHDAIGKFKLTQQYIGWLHGQLDHALGKLLRQDEGFHAAVQYELLWMASTAALVIMATLIVQLVRIDGMKNGDGR